MLSTAAVAAVGGDSVPYFLHGMRMEMPSQVWREKVMKPNQ
jgi:hypothetical protein